MTRKTLHTSLHFLGAQYGRFCSSLAAQIRIEAYGVDMGQQGWRTEAEHRDIIAQGPFHIVPPGVNEMMLEQAGFALLSLRDTTVEMGQIASRLHHARQARREVLCVEEGRDWFDSRQAFLSTVAQLAESRRLSRYLYIAEKRTS